MFNFQIVRKKIRETPDPVRPLSLGAIKVWIHFAGVVVAWQECRSGPCKILKKKPLVIPDSDRTSVGWRKL